MLHAAAVMAFYTDSYVDGFSLVVVLVWNEENDPTLS
jgi:hypothetical protein